MTRTNPPTTNKHHGLTLFIVDMKSPGITVRPLLNYYGRHHFNEVFFDNFRVPVANLVGQEQRVWYHLMQALVFERRSLAPTIYGQFKRLLEELVQYSKETKHEGRPPAQDTAIRNRLAKMAIDLETIKLFAYHLTWKISQGVIPPESSRNKISADDILKHVAFSSADILGTYSQVDPNSK